MMHLETHQQSCGSPLLSGQLVCCRLKNQFSHKYFFVFVLKCATVKRSAFWRDWM